MHASSSSSYYSNDDHADASDGDCYLYHDTQALPWAKMHNDLTEGLVELEPSKRKAGSSI